MQLVGLTRKRFSRHRVFVLLINNNTLLAMVADVSIVSILQTVSGNIETHVC